MKKIIVAGAGHGGLTCAAKLAKNGYDVTVFEAKAKEEIGYDWDDSIMRNVFEVSDVESPDESFYLPLMRQAYFNPKKNVKLVMPDRKNDSCVLIDRKVLANHLIDFAEEAGVKFVFNAKLSKAVTKGDTVIGVSAFIDGIEKEYYCDLVVDSAGIDSLVRKSLPSVCSIKNEIKPNEIFYVYRAYYEKDTEGTAYPEYNIYFYHCKNCGMDWAVINEDFVDVLVGSFTPFKENTVENAVSDFQREYPFMKNNIVRGGQTGRIPLRRTLPIIVCNGYAAVGDSASMTEMLSGSGLVMSMKAGRMLAETVVEAGDCAFSKEVLWKYQYNYFTKIGNRELGNEQLKHFLSSVGSDGMDYLMETGIITEAELRGGAVNYSLLNIADKAIKLLKRPVILKQAIKMLMGNVKVDMVCKTMPESYDKTKIDKWQKQYENLI